MRSNLPLAIDGVPSNTGTSRGRLAATTLLGKVGAASDRGDNGVIGTATKNASAAFVVPNGASTSKLPVPS